MYILILGFTMVSLIQTDIHISKLRLTESKSFKGYDIINNLAGLYGSVLCELLISKFGNKSKIKVFTNMQKVIVIII